jgi:hypothetical protein
MPLSDPSWIHRNPSELVPTSRAYSYSPDAEQPRVETGLCLPSLSIEAWAISEIKASGWSCRSPPTDLRAALSAEDALSKPEQLFCAEELEEPGPMILD